MWHRLVQTALSIAAFVIHLIPVPVIGLLKRVSVNVFSVTLLCGRQGRVAQRDECEVSVCSLSNADRYCIGRPIVGSNFKL